MKAPCWYEQVTSEMDTDGFTGFAVCLKMRWTQAGLILARKRLSRSKASARICDVASRPLNRVDGERKLFRQPSSLELLAMPSMRERPPRERRPCTGDRSTHESRT